MYYRYYRVMLMCATLIACGDELERNQAVSVSPADNINNIVGVENTVLSEPVVTATKGVSIPTSLPILDLSLPAGVLGDVPDLSSARQDRFGVEGWFDQSGKDEPPRLQLKTKLRLKEDVEFDKNSDLGSYADSVDGAEVGFEYKTP